MSTVNEKKLMLLLQIIVSFIRGLCNIKYLTMLLEKFSKEKIDEEVQNACKSLNDYCILL